MPHNLHREIYCAAISAGKHLMGEKPFGIDQPANDAILACIAEHPGVFVRCSSEFPFFPAVQRIGRMIEAGSSGESSRSTPGSCIPAISIPKSRSTGSGWSKSTASTAAWATWACTSATCRSAPAGFRGPFARCCRTSCRAAGRPRRHRRPAKRGTTPRCCATRPTRPPATSFPMTLKTQRIAPGEKDTWYLEVLGTRASARFSTKNPKRLELLDYTGGEQVWGRIDMGHETAFKSITGGDFRVRLFRCDFPDVGGLPRRIGAWSAAGPVRRLRDARGNRPEPSTFHRRPGIAANGSHRRRLNGIFFPSHDGEATLDVMTAILGISAFYHDSAAAIGRRRPHRRRRAGRTLHAGQTRQPFPVQAIQYCLKEAGLEAEQLDYVGFYDKPLLKFERLLETYLAFAPSGFRSFCLAMPVWLNQKLHLPREIRKGLGDQYRRRYVYTEHHESHAASAFFPSPFEEAAILTLDGVGEWATASLG